MKNEFKPDYISIPYPVYIDQKLESTDRVLYGIIYWFHGMKYGICTASNETLAQVAGVSPRSIPNALTNLEKRGYIKRLFKDSSKRHRSEIIPMITFKNIFLNATSANPDTRVGESPDTRVGEQIQNTNTKKNTKVTAPIGADAQKAIAEVIDAFKNVNPSYKILFNRPAQRDAAARLIKQHGMQNLLAKMIPYLPQSNASRYAPTITTPIQLESKLGQLKAWADKERSGKRGAGAGVTV